MLMIKDSRVPTICLQVIVAMFSRNSSQAQHNCVNTTAHDDLSVTVVSFVYVRKSRGPRTVPWGTPRDVDRSL